MRCSRAAVLALMCAAQFVAPVVLVGPARAGEVVEAGAPVYAGRGVIVLWAILRGGDGAGVAVLRVLPEDVGLTAFAADLTDRAGQERAGLVPPSLVSGWEEIRVARGRLADRQRLELHLAQRLEDLLGRPPQPAVTVFFVGVPDTTPEVTSEAALSAYFANALNRARARQPAVSPPR